jgi:biotin transport system substrate-specific component
MTAQTLQYPSLVNVIWDKPSWTRNIILLAAGVVLLTVSAKLKIPFYPVPMTMQTFMVLVIGMAFGWRLGAATLFAYLAAGAMGLPVFAGTPEKGLGLVYMTGPTGGYLLGFLLGAIATGFLAERGWDRRASTTFLAMLVGNIIIYVPGLMWLGAVLGWEKPIIEWGLTPFLLGDLAKIALAMLVMPAAWKLVGRRH